MRSDCRAWQAASAVGDKPGAAGDTPGVTVPPGEVPGAAEPSAGLRRDWKAIAGLLGERCPRADVARAGSDVSSHAQKHFIKMCIAGEALPAKVCPGLAAVAAQVGIEQGGQRQGRPAATWSAVTQAQCCCVRAGAAAHLIRDVRCAAGAGAPGRCMLGGCGSLFSGRRLRRPQLTQDMRCAAGAGARQARWGAMGVSSAAGACGAPSSPRTCAALQVQEPGRHAGGLWVSLQRQALVAPPAHQGHALRCRCRSQAGTLGGYGSLFSGRRLRRPQLTQDMRCAAGAGARQARWGAVGLSSAAGACGAPSSPRTCAALQVQESGRGYTLGGGLLNPFSSSATAYGMTADKFARARPVCLSAGLRWRWLC